ncbi:aldose epimerase family protein [Wenyingzhuangia sp. IMCC45467]
MFKINKLQENGLNYIQIVKADHISSAKICLDRGAALETLTLNSIPVIVDLHPLEYKNTYASSILFPFANRIKDGAYTYDEVDYKFDCNEANNNNALHGLVFDKTFEVIDSEVSDIKASVTVAYTATTKNKAFPYIFSIALTYTLTDKTISVNVEVKNNDDITFPFTIGWHPYFLSDDLCNSSLEFSTSKEYEFDERMITKGEELKEVTLPFEIENKQLDNCYALTNGTIVFNTPKYKMVIESSAQENFFQMYTPPKKNVIALEPVTGISNSFNNRIGLQELKANEEYKINWTVTIE